MLLFGFKVDWVFHHFYYTVNKLFTIFIIFNLKQLANPLIRWPFVALFNLIYINTLEYKCPVKNLYSIFLFRIKAN